MSDHRSWRALTSDALGLLFGALWASRGAQAGHLGDVATALIVAIPTILLLAGFCWRDLVLRKVEAVHDAALLRRTKVLRIAAIFAISFWTHANHHLNLFYPLLGAVIGFSYIPLGRALREPVHYAMGGAIVLVSILSLLLPKAQHMQVAGFGTALALWAGNTFRLWRAGLPPVAGMVEVAADSAA